MNNDDAGFTLLETIVALAIIGMVLTALSGGLRLGVRAVDATTRLTTQDDDLVVLDQVFRKLLSSAMAGTTLIDLPFQGEPHSLHFTAALSDMRGGLTDISLRVDARHRLLLTTQPHYAAPLTAPAASMSVLLPSVDRIDLDYATASSWHAQWSATGLPDLVRLHLVRPPRSGAVLPDIVAQTWLGDRAQ